MFLSFLTQYFAKFETNVFSGFVDRFSPVLLFCITVMSVCLYCICAEFHLHWEKKKSFSPPKSESLIIFLRN